MLEVKHLSRHYDSFKAVDNVSFTIAKGEIVGLLGHNGAGKTTIMKMISGYLEPNVGQIALDGNSLAEAPKEVQKLIGYLPENLPVYPEMTVADYLDYAADLKGLKNNDKTAEIKRAIKATDIGSKLLSPIAKLSRGFKQRVGVAQAILGKPKLLILDEPTNGLDPEQTQHMRDLILDIANSATVILSTHIMQEVEALCSRVLIIRSGQLVIDSGLEALRSSNVLTIETDRLIDEKLFTDSDLKELSPCSDLNGKKQYRFEIPKPEQKDQVCSEVAKQIIESGAALYTLKTEQRDLETLFREVNSDTNTFSALDGGTEVSRKENGEVKGGLSHAA